MTTPLTAEQIEVAARKLCRLSNERQTKANINYFKNEITTYLHERHEHWVIEQAIQHALSREG